MFTPKKLLIFIFTLTIGALILDLPKAHTLKFNLFGQDFNIPLNSPEINFSFGGISFKRDLEIKKGLDLQGGAHLVLKADMNQVEESDRDDALVSAKEIISKRIDLYGIVEPVIQTSKTKDDYRIIVELPGVTDVDQAIGLIGRTAQLDFRVLPEEEKKKATPSAVPIFAYQKTDLTGKDLKKANVQFSQETSEPVVGLEFTQEGKEKFAQITKENVNFPVAIFLDEQPLTAPRVNELILDGKAVISGQFDVKKAKNLTIQLNAGALPVPVKVVSQKTIGPTLGQESINKSVRAGLIGLSIVILFMAAYYGFLGTIADIGLIIYGILTLAVYKLIPITLTLPGIAGFILSVGMAVDANILIFERMKEEIRIGKKWRGAMEVGFGRAWDSIKDANVCTIVTALVLLNPFNWPFLVTSGMIRGFALTLLIGVLIGLFTGIVVTRTLLRAMYRRKD